MRRIRILVINQHGENRGDEAAMRAMLRGLSKAINQPIEFDIIVQFRDKSLKILLEHMVRFHNILPSVPQFIGLMLFAVARKCGLSAKCLLGPGTREVVKAYEDADMIISAPGGPYFGDIYATHEPLHWFYVLLGAMYKKPLFLYAASCGPFRKRIYNIVRRSIYRKFKIVCVREYLSYCYLKNLLKSCTNIRLTADSVLQENIIPFDRREYFEGQRAYLGKKFLIAVAGMEYRFPGESDPNFMRKKFNSVIIQLMACACQLCDCHFIFMPQFYGKVHDDRRYHTWLGEQLPLGTSWEIVPGHFNSDQHRRIFGMVDMCFASRYHPQIFSTSCGVPGIFFCYEHKQMAYLTSIGIEDLAYDIRYLNGRAVCLKLKDLFMKRHDISANLLANVSKLKAKSQDTNLFAREVYRENNS